MRSVYRPPTRNQNVIQYEMRNEKCTIRSAKYDKEDQLEGLRNVLAYERVRLIGATDSGGICNINAMMLLCVALCIYENKYV